MNIIFKTHGSLSRLRRFAIIGSLFAFFGLIAMYYAGFNVVVIPAFCVGPLLIGGIIILILVIFAVLFARKTS